MLKFNFSSLIIEIKNIHNNKNKNILGTEVIKSGQIISPALINTSIKISLDEIGITPTKKIIDTILISIKSIIKNKKEKEIIKIDDEKIQISITGDIFNQEKKSTVSLIKKEPEIFHDFQEKLKTIAVPKVNISGQYHSMLSKNQQRRVIFLECLIEHLNSPDLDVRNSARKLGEKLFNNELALLDPDNRKEVMLRMLG